MPNPLDLEGSMKCRFSNLDTRLVGRKSMYPEPNGTENLSISALLIKGTTTSNV